MTVGSDQAERRPGLAEPFVQKTGRIEHHVGDETLQRMRAFIEDAQKEHTP